MSGPAVVIRNAGIPAEQGLRRADIAIAPPFIQRIADRVDVAGATELDAGGLVVVPGFIDAHVHGEVSLLTEPVHEPALRQGVTTYVLGQDGTSITPGSPSTRRAMGRYFAPVNGDPSELSIPGSVAELLARYDGASTAHAAFLVPNGNLRYEIVGPEQREATAGELRGMRQLLGEALAGGAAGLSSGLDYVPSAYADLDELAALAEVVADHGKVYVSHMRWYGPRAGVGIAELVEIARRTGVRVHVSHFSGAREHVLPHVERALEDGVDLTYDTYPFTAASSVLHMYLLPAEMQTGGPEALLARLASRAGARAAAEAVHRRDGAADRLRVAFADHPDWRWSEGLTLGEIARERGLGVGEAAVRMLLETRLGVSVVFARDTFTLEDCWDVAAHARHMSGSDGIFLGSRPHPRGWATFATMLRRHIDGGLGWTWPQLVDHLSGNAARRFGLTGRGVLAEGARADLVVFDPARVRPRATYAEPRRTAEGIVAVLLDGIAALWNGEPTGERPGRGLVV